MSNTERFMKHNKKPTDFDGPKTKDVDFEHLVPNDELTFNKEFHQDILDSVNNKFENERQQLLIDTVDNSFTKYKEYSNEQNRKRKPYDIFMAVVQVIGSISALIAAIVAIYSLL